MRRFEHVHGGRIDGDMRTSGAAMTCVRTNESRGRCTDGWSCICVAKWPLYASSGSRTVMTDRRKDHDERLPNLLSVPETFAAYQAT